MPAKRNNDPERRIVSTEITIRSLDGKNFIQGHAAVFNSLSQNLGGFVERVRPGAFTKTLKEADVRALLNHDPNFVLGRSSSQTLELSQDDIGLLYRINPPATSYANDLMALMVRGDIRESSFGFFALDEDWGLTEQGFPVRDIIEASLVDVSVVTYPAYTAADSGLARSSALVELEKRSGVPMAEMLNDPEQVKCAVGKCTVRQEPVENHSGLSDEEKHRLDELIAIDAELRGNQ